MTHLNRNGHTSFQRAILSAISNAEELGVHATINGLSCLLEACPRETSIATAELVADGELRFTSTGLRLACG